jgi:hypothetical protein
LHDDVTKALQALGLALAPGTLDAALSAAEKESLSHLQFLHRLLAGPAEAKQARALERRIRAAGFRERTTLEGCVSRSGSGLSLPPEERVRR